MNEWVWILFWVAILVGMIIFAQFQSEAESFIASAPGDLSFGSAIVYFQGEVFVSSHNLSNNAGAVFKIKGLNSNLEKDTAEFGKNAQQFGTFMFSDGYTRTIVSGGDQTRNGRDTSGLVTVNGAYNGELTGFEQPPTFAFTVQDQTIVSSGTEVYVYQHLTRNTNYLAYIFEARPSSMDAFNNRICWRTDTTCTVLSRAVGTEYWEKSYEFETDADIITLSSDILFGVNNGILYTTSLGTNGKTVTTQRSTQVNGITRICWDNSRSKAFVAVDDGQSISVFRYLPSQDKFDLTGNVAQTGLIDMVSVADNKLIISADFDIYPCNLYANNIRFSDASQLNNENLTLT